MLKPQEIELSALGELKSEVLKQAKIELWMNLSLLEMLKGNTPLEDMANLREQWVEPFERIIEELRSPDPSDRRRQTDEGAQ
jgi:hypothetical protein